MGGKLDSIAKAQEMVADKIDVDRKEMVSELKELHRDLVDRLEGRLQKVETDVVDIRSQVKLKPTRFLRGSYIYFLIPRTGRDVLDRCQKKKPWKR